MSESFERTMFVAAEEVRRQRVAGMLPSETIWLRQEVAELRAELEKRPSAEAVQSAVANAQFILDGDGVLPAYRQLLEDAIAGLTGKGGV